MQFIAVSLIGIPAAGKTSIVHRIVDLSKLGTLCASVIVVSFDEYINVDFSNIHDGEYKRLREKLLQKIEVLLGQLLKNEIHQWDEVLTSNELKIERNNFCFKTSNQTLIILDDNNYYHSMRQRNRALSRTFPCQHFQIFIKSSLDEARKRNKNRLRQVPESIIDKMFGLLETPKNPRTIIIDSAVDDETLLFLLHDRMKNPEKQIETDGTQQHQSILHEMDIITRKELSRKIQSLKPSRDISSYCNTLNRKRKEFLANIRKEGLADVATLHEAFLCYLDRQL